MREFGDNFVTLHRRTHDMGAFLQNILQLILSPSRGWEDIAASAIPVEKLRRRCVFPIMAVAALTAFAQLFFHPDLTIASEIIKGASIFISLFAAYCLGDAMMRMFMFKMVDGEVEADMCQTVACYAYGMLALVRILCNLLPVSLGLPVLLPVAVGVIVWKAGSLLHVRGDMELSYAIFVFAALILPPMLLQYLFDNIIMI